MSEMNITAVVETFVQNLVAAVEVSVAERVQAAIAGVFGAPQKRGPGNTGRGGCCGCGGKMGGGENTAKAALPSARLQERRGTSLRHGLQRPQERSQVQNREIPGGTQGHARERSKTGGGEEGIVTQGGTGTETSRAIHGCLEITDGRGPREGKTDR